MHWKTNHSIALLWHILKWTSIVQDDISCTLYVIGRDNNRGLLVKISWICLSSLQEGRWCQPLSCTHWCDIPWTLEFMGRTILWAWYTNGRLEVWGISYLPRRYWRNWQHLVTQYNLFCHLHSILFKEVFIHNYTKGYLYQDFSGQITVKCGYHLF